MALIIGFPQPGEVWGPGFVLTVSTDLIGPQPPGTVWEIDLEAMESSVVWGRWTTPFVFNAIRTTWVNGDASESDVLAPEHLLTTGDDARLHIKLKQSDGTVIDEDDVAIILDMTQGQAWQVQEYIRTHPPAASGGLTTAEHNAVLATQAAVLADIGPGLGDLVQSIGQLITRPTLAIGSLSSPAYELEGDGEIPGISDLLHSRFGIYWLATTIPAGLGHLHGNTEEYMQRLVQFRTLHVLDGVELVTEVFDANWHGGLWTWSTPKPSAIEYSILPGVHIQVRWWQFP